MRERPPRRQEAPATVVSWGIRVGCQTAQVFCPRAAKSSGFGHCSVGEASEIAAAAALLASDQGGFFVGATLDLNGGLFMR
jgi:hypothetical protein